ncbi:hypothetical protein HN51_018330 [Arachis hypogaea]
MGERLVMSKAKPYLLTVGLQFGLAGTYIFSMASLNHGMSRYVFVVYRNLIAAISLAPFAFFFERKVRPKMTLSVFIRILVLGLLEPVIDQGFTFLGMQYTSASFASAIMNAVPSVTFVLAVIFRARKRERGAKPSKGDWDIGNVLWRIGDDTLQRPYYEPFWFFTRNP